MPRFFFTQGGVFRREIHTKLITDKVKWQNCSSHIAFVSLMTYISKAELEKTNNDTKTNMKPENHGVFLLKCIVLVASFLNSTITSVGVDIQISWNCTSAGYINLL